MPAHWIRRNESNRIPRRHISLDTEAVQVEEGGRRVQTFRCAVACLDSQHSRGEKWRPPEWGRFTDPWALWQWVDGCTRTHARTVVVAHNLAYDLRISQAFIWLPKLGWELVMVRLDGGQAWAHWKRDDRSIAMVDTMSWFSVGLAELGDLIGEPKPPLPKWDDPLDVWMARCEADVQILRLCWGRVLRWIEEDDLGNWKPTGAGQGWAAFRHRWMDTRILHHGLDSVATLEREAAWTGRCEAWRWGRLPRGVWT